MSKKMLINATHPEENRVAIVEDGILSELDIEVGGKEQTKGNIYKAVVVRVEPGLQAAFVDYGAERLGFLQMGELHPAFFKVEKEESKGRPRINDLLRRGQELLVQIVKEERGTKGAALTTYLSLPGRYMVLMPETDTKGISRKIEEEPQRKKLKEAMRSLDLPQNMGYIVRTAGIGQTPEELKRDFDYLTRVYGKIRALSKQVKAPALVYKESNLVIRSIRDYFSSDMDEVLVDDPKVFQEAKEFFQEVMPEFARLVKLHQERRPIFSRYQIEEQIETISKNKVPLPSGGSIVLDSTEALVAVDVNSGKMAGEQGVEATAFKTNMEAAAEVARQLRLRDLGGLIVIDFIDMRDRKHIREVEKCLKDALKNDKARVTVGRISSQFSLLEMSRQRIKSTLAAGSYLSCPHCEGTGKVKSPEAQSVAFLRKVQAGIAKGQIGRVEGDIPLEVATYLLNNKRGELVEMERQHRLAIHITGRTDLLAGQVELTFIRREDLEEEAEELHEAIVATPGAHFEAPAPETAAELAEQAEEAEEAGETEEESGEGGKKKRRRRRRKKKGEAPPVVAEDAEAEEAAAAGPSVPAAEAQVPGEPQPAATATAAADVEHPAGETEEVKKKRRRRRKKKPAAPAEAAAAAGPQPAEPVEPAGTGAPAPAAAAKTEPAQVEAKVEAPAAAAAEPPAEKPAEAAPATAQPSAPPADAQPEAAAPAPQEPAAAVAAPAEAPVVKEEKKAKPARPRSRARKPKSDAEEAPAAPAATAPAASEEPGVKSTVAPSPQPAAAAENTPEAPAAPAKASPKPRKRAPRKKAEPVQAEKVEAAKKEALPTMQPAPSAEAPAKPAAKAPAAAKPKPRTRKTAASSTKAAAAEAAGTEAEAAKPAPKKRAPRKKPAAAAKEEPQKTE
ncbi:hypothetical protein DESUT3_15660 [Desulfuromonas versatilis]|uniref:Ribonuclease G n=1 Tax=Desulfuromonas versatilis TaxID=2802975 RepID=A0ABN6DWV5_9BACT|nr:Rne/Rng family ribonuclease [Desulfuromonas versatilis]BCR04497.1 hypothetical protein DESUT3_15660 [Desulfuromonas versatilis]